MQQEKPGRVEEEERGGEGEKDDADEDNQEDGKDEDQDGYSTRGARTRARTVRGDSGHLMLGERIIP